MNLTDVANSNVWVYLGSLLAGFLGVPSDVEGDGEEGESGQESSSSSRASPQLLCLKQTCLTTMVVQDAELSGRTQGRGESLSLPPHSHSPASLHPAGAPTLSSSLC